MKKFLFSLLISLCACVMPVSAQTYYYKATDFAYKQVNDYGYWTNWSSWEVVNISMTIDFTNDIVSIYSKTPQIYRITEHVRNYTDNSGGVQAEFRFIDQDGDNGTMRLRIETNGNSQLYVEFSNIMWVYNVKRIR